MALKDVLKPRSKEEVLEIISTELKEFVETFFPKDFKWRPGQKEAILEIITTYHQNKHKVVILDAPIGSGKSCIAMATAYLLNKQNKKGYILASDISLQEQYEQDFKEFQLPWGSVKGIDNYICIDNMEKNSFVSMFYAVLDVRDKTLTFARAGHNPGIMINQKDGSTQDLHTDGIALGLEEGTVFNKLLKEQTINLEKGDTLVFYTDGFTEAMNSVHEEFGEKKFVDLIAQNRNRSAKELIDILVKAIHEFSKDTPQHDDMTVIVIKMV